MRGSGKSGSHTRLSERPINLGVVEAGAREGVRVQVLLPHHSKAVYLADRWSVLFILNPSCRIGRGIAPAGRRAAWQYITFPFVADPGKLATGDGRGTACIHFLRRSNGRAEFDLSAGQIPDHLFGRGQHSHRVEVIVIADVRDAE